MSDAFFKCRFCDYRVRKIRTLKDGKTVSGWISLANHIEDFHPNEDEKLDEIRNEDERHYS